MLCFTSSWVPATTCTVIVTVTEVWPATAPRSQRLKGAATKLGASEAPTKFTPGGRVSQSSPVVTGFETGLWATSV